MSLEAGTTRSRIDVALQPGAVEAQSLPWPADCGAEVVFLGRTRLETHPQHGPLQHLDYEVYEPMAVKLLQRMAREAAERFGCPLVRLVHARGRVLPGQASVVIQVAAPHRGEAFTACRHLIDRLKHELPVWKREVWQRGETFVQGCCVQTREARPAGKGDDHA